jgi:hypothetical protein
VPEVLAAGDTKSELNALVENEESIISALHDVIPETGQKAWSEALERLLEH